MGNYYLINIAGHTDCLLLKKSQTINTPKMAVLAHALIIEKIRRYRKNHTDKIEVQTVEKLNPFFILQLTDKI